MLITNGSSTPSLSAFSSVRVLRFIALLLLCCGASLSTYAAEAGDFRGLSWTGLWEDRNHLYRFQLSIADISEQQSTGGGYATDIALTFAEMPGQSFSRPPRQPEVTVSGVLFPDWGVIQIHGLGHLYPHGLLAVVGEERNELALTGLNDEHLPVILSLGDQLPALLQKISSADGQQGDAEALTSSKNALPQQTPQQKMQALFLAITEAHRAGDTARAQALTAEMQVIGQQAVSSSVAQQVRTTSVKTCPESVSRWLAHLASNSSDNPVSLAVASNLFRPELLEDALETPVAELAQEKRRELGGALKKACLSDPALDLQYTAINQIAQAFNKAESNKFLMLVSAGMANQRLSDWAAALPARMASDGERRTVNSLLNHVHTVVQSLWPKELVHVMASVKKASREVQLAEVFGKIDKLVDAGKGELLVLLEQLNFLRRSSEIRTLPPEVQQEVLAYLQQQSETLIAQTLPQRYLKGGQEDPELALMDGKSWYQQNNRLLRGYGNSAAIKEFVPLFKGHRQILFDVYFAELEASGAKASPSVRDEMVLPLDDVEELLQRYAPAEPPAMARFTPAPVPTGAAPFGQDFPGADYLNALYFQDEKRLVELDEDRFAPLVRGAQAVEGYRQQMSEVLAAFSGGKVTQGEVADAFDLNPDQLTTLRFMASYFIAFYEELAEECMDPSPVRYRRTIVYERIPLNGIGYRESSTVEGFYNISRRHKPLFDRIGWQGEETADVIGMLNGTFGGLIPGSYKPMLNGVRNSLRGLEQAMRQYPCDGEVMRSIETSLLTLTPRVLDRADGR